MSIDLNSILNTIASDDFTHFIQTIQSINSHPSTSIMNTLDMRNILADRMKAHGIKDEMSERVRKGDDPLPWINLIAAVIDTIGIAHFNGVYIARIATGQATAPSTQSFQPTDRINPQDVQLTNEPRNPTEAQRAQTWTVENPTPWNTKR